MSRGLNRIELIGNVGRDPEMRYTPSGAPVTQFSLAVNSFRRSAQTGQPTEETDWFTIVCWNRLAEFADQYIRKGTKVYVAGRLRVRRFTGNDGTERTAVEVIAREVLLLSPRPADAPVPAAAVPVEEVVPGPDLPPDVTFDDEDPWNDQIPF
ncbi:MAG: single-stranded DNA-binding protein [Thermomicrobium sp.]|nr:single-stranded DNA-binding protein [Thermomicrobium sp.]MDW8058495.1 single-stranded DNA-binding protein [Thermomicrobium sp.]